MPIPVPIIAAAVQAAGSIGGGLLSRPSAPKETKIQKQQRHLIDQLLGSLSGKGKYADLFNADEATFQKSYVDPAKSLFRNQIAPTIQQEYIASGQQRGTGLEDQLLRAGVDLDMMLNQAMAQQRESALNRKQNAIGAILGQAPGPGSGMSTGEAFRQSAAGYLSSPAFTQAATSLFGGNQPQAGRPMQSPVMEPTRKGFLPDWNMGDPRWGKV